ncbi:MAG: hypothetical protein CMH64_02535 [Nanoarchaeota archaeon]|nr:hypothetical protein [Nanoarchaeota archaeon]
MIFDFFIYSFNSLKARKTRTLLTMVGIFIGIAAVVSLISLGSGFQKAVTAQFSNLGTDMLTVQAAETGFGPPGSTALTKLTNDDFNAVKKVSGVKTVAKRYIRAVNIKFREKSLVNAMSSLPPDEGARDLMLTSLNLEIEEGRWLKTEDKFKVVLGSSFAQDKFSRPIHKGDKVKINDVGFEVVGILVRAGSPQFNDMVLVNEPILEDLLEVEDEMDLMVVQVSNANEIEKVARNMEKTLRKSRDVEEGKENFNIETPQKLVESFTAVLDVVAVILIGIAAISLVVGGIGIMNTMYTAVLERTQEIGIMKSIGATNNDILSIFLMESGMLGLIGGAIGVFLGASFSKLVEVGAAVALGPSVLVADVSLGLVIGSLSFSFLIGTVSGILPAKQASSLQPVDALRK